MRVLQLSWEYPPHVVGGLGRHVAELLPALASVGVQVSLVTPRLRNGSARERSSSGVQILRVEPPRMDRYDYPSFVSETGARLLQTAQELRAEVGHFDLIHAHDWLVAEAAIQLKHQWRVPLIATIHATERGRGRGWLSGPAARRINDLEWQLTYEAWRVIVCSHFMAGQIRDYFQTPTDKIDVVPNGVYISQSPFDDAEHWLGFRRRFVADDERMVFYVGRIVYEKGLQVLIAAWPEVAAQARARLVIAGVGEHLESLKAQVESLGLNNEVIFAGFIADEDRDRFYHTADLAIFPSLYEPFGIVALEALAAACPLIVSDTGGLAEVVRNEYTGLIVPTDNSAALAAAIIDALDHPDVSRVRAANALRVVREHYTWPRIATITSAIYSQVFQAWDSGSWGKELSKS